MSIYSLPYFSNNKKSPSDFDSYNNLNLWLDATDPSGDGTFFSSDASLNFWNDKSKYKNKASALLNNATNGPTNISYLKSGFNSNYPTFVFNENRGRFAGQLLNSSAIISVDAMRVFIVGSIDSSNAMYHRLMGFSETEYAHDFSNQNSWSFLKYTNTGMVPYRNNAYPTSYTSITYNTPLIWEAWFTGTAGNTRFLNGTTNPPTGSYSSTSGNFNINYYSIGQNTNAAADPTGFLNGKISEILVYKGTLTNSQVSIIEGYLAWKWGLQGTLSSAHTYKNSAP